MQHCSMVLLRTGRQMAAFRKLALSSSSVIFFQGREHISCLILLLMSRCAPSFLVALSRLGLTVLLVSGPRKLLNYPDCLRYCRAKTPLRKVKSPLCQNSSTHFHWTRCD